MKINKFKKILEDNHRLKKQNKLLIEINKLSNHLIEKIGTENLLSDNKSLTLAIATKINPYYFYKYPKEVSELLVKKHLVALKEHIFKNKQNQND